MPVVIPASLRAWHVEHFAAKSCLPRSKSPSVETPHPERASPPTTASASATSGAFAGMVFRLVTRAGILSAGAAARGGGKARPGAFDRVEPIGTFAPGEAQIWKYGKACRRWC